MKVFELIHGGLYLIHDASDIVVRYDITSNSFRSEWYEYSLALFHNDVCATDGDRYIFVKPIPLTEEILKKNGFIIKYADYKYWENDKYIISFYYDILRITELLSAREVFCMEKNAWNVHDLQRALRLCGLNEHADDFKVE